MGVDMPDGREATLPWLHWCMGGADRARLTARGVAAMADKGEECVVRGGMGGADRAWLTARGVAALAEGGGVRAVRR